MKYGICNLSIVPMRAEACDKSELVSQVLYGDRFQVLEERKNWARIRTDFDKYEGWIDSKQYVPLTEKDYFQLGTSESTLVPDLMEFSVAQNNSLIPIPMGADISGIHHFGHYYEGSRIIPNKENKANIVRTAFLYLNAPYLWGGKTPFGIDCSGFTQMVYKLNGFTLFRDASQQATQGETLGFIEECEPGDLAFFDNDEGEIIHVGIVMKDNYIIHAHGKVRIDRLDHNGIFNNDTNRYSHRLRVLKKMV